MLVNENNSMPYMKSLATCLNRMVQEWYTEDFQIKDDSLYGMNSGRMYTPLQIKVANFFRFEGMSDPDDNAVLYVIETDDGVRGTLIDAYGVYHDPRISRFIKQVEDIHKNVTH